MLYPSDNDWNFLIGKELKAKRRSLKLSLRIVSSLTGISVHRLSHYESGKKEIPASDLYRLALLYKANPSDIIERVLFLLGLPDHNPPLN